MYTLPFIHPKFYSCLRSDWLGIRKFKWLLGAILAKYIKHEDGSIYSEHQAYLGPYDKKWNKYFQVGHDGDSIIVFEFQTMPIETINSINITISH